MSLYAMTKAVLLTYSTGVGVALEPAVASTVCALSGGGADAEVTVTTSLKIEY